MNIMQIVNIQLTEKAKQQLSHASYVQASEWLTQWTPRGNFKAVVSESRAESLAMLTKDLQENLAPSWMREERGVQPHHFEFEVSEQDVEDGRFWMPSIVVWCQWHKIPEMAA
jgi:hypothetical protein